MKSQNFPASRLPRSAVAIAAVLALSASVHGAAIVSTWNGAVNGNWNVNGSWSNASGLGGYPNDGNGGVATYDAVISATGAAYAVTLNTDVTVENLTLNSANATLSQTSGTLTANSGLAVSAGTYLLSGGTLASTAVTLSGAGSLALAGGTIQGGTITGSSSGVGLLVNSSSTGTLDGVNLGTNLLVSNSSTLNVKDGLILGSNARITLASAGGSTYLKFGSGTQTLSGTGDVFFAGTAGFNYLFAAGGGSAATASNFTIGAGITVHGNQNGSIFSLGDFSSITNLGTILADTAGKNIALSGKWNSLGTIKTENGGTVTFSGTLANTGQTLDFPTGTGPLTLSGGWTIRGGAITNSGGGAGLLIAASSTGTLDGVNIDTNLVLPGAANFGTATLNVTNGLTLSDNARMTVASSGGPTYLKFGSGAQTLSGKGDVYFAGTASNNYLYASGGGSAATASNLTIGPGITVHGSKSGTIGASLNFQPPSYDSITNLGTILADTAGTTITLTGNWASLGTIKTQNGGVVALSGSLNNAGQTLDFPAGTGPLTLNGGSIHGGAITNSGGGAGLLVGIVGSTVTASTLDGVNLGSNLLVSNNGSLHVTNGLILSGNARITLSNNYLSFDAGTQTLGGIGDVYFGGTGSNGFLRTYGNGLAANLIIGPGITVHGSRSGTIQATGSFDSITNQGTILGDTAGTTIALAGNWTTPRLGTIKTQNGGVVALTGTLDNTGQTLDFPAGTGPLTLAGTITGGTITSSGGGVPLLIGSQGTLDGVNLGSNLSIPSNARLNIKDGLTLSNNARITLVDTSYFQSLQFGPGTQTLGGNGEVFLGGTLGLANAVYANSDGFTTPSNLTIGSGITIHGNQGGIVEASYSSDSITNLGIILADATGKTIALVGNWNSLGTFKTLNGGIITFNGTLNNVGQTLDFAAGFGPLTLTSGWTIRGGAITNSGGGAGLQVAPSSAGGLDGVNLGTSLTIPSGVAVGVINGLTLSNNARVSIACTGTASYVSSYLNFGAGTQTLSGTGEVFFGGTSANNYLKVENGNLTVGPGITVHGSQSGTIQVMGSLDSITNLGTILADTAGTTITLAGYWTTLGLGTIKTQNGGVVALSGTLANTGRTLDFPAGTGPLTLSGGTIQGGTIVNTGGGLGLLVGSSVPIVSSGTLDGVTLATNLAIPSSASLHVKHGLTLSNNAQINMAGSDDLFFDSGTQTLGGAGHVYLGSPSLFAAYGDGTRATPAALTIGAGIIVHGSQNGTIEAVWPNDSITNLGTILADTAGKTITIRSSVPYGMFIDRGTMEARNGGALSVPAGYTQTAGITKVSGGTITAGTITNAAGWIGGSGTIIANVNDQDIIAAGFADVSAAGTLAITGDLTLAGTSTLELGIGGRTQGSQYGLLTETGTVPLTLAGSLSVAFFQGFQFSVLSTDSFTVLISNEPINGMFSNVLAGRVATSDGNGTFAVSTAGNQVTLSNYVANAPEPAAGILFMLGIPALLGLRRRR